MDNNVVPDKATRDEIFGVVKALLVGERKGAKTGLKRAFTSWPSIIGIWIPAILFAVSISLGIIYTYDLFGLGKPKFHQLTAFEQAEMILYAALGPAVAGKARKGDFVRGLDHFKLRQSPIN
jgi:hypothetical protein